MQYIMDLVILRNLGKWICKFFNNCADREKNLPREIAKYCFSLNMVRLNGTLTFLYLLKWRKGAYVSSFRLSGRFNFSLSLVEPDPVFKLMV